MECVSHFGRILNNADPNSMWNQSRIASNSGSFNENVELDIDYINNYFLDGLNVSYDNICEHTPKLEASKKVPKTGASFNTENLRHVSTLPIVSKVLEHVIISQISRHIAQFHLLNDRQTGVVEFRVCSVYAFQDDIQLLFHGLQSKDALQMIIHDTWVENWMKSNPMLLNISKPKIMRFGAMDPGDVELYTTRALTVRPAHYQPFMNIILIARTKPEDSVLDSENFNLPAILPVTKVT
uniref:Reverse transcriptase domain-containing protein n=1 Tax=Glossina austeni TaxID=7395 RepID=A0A1A9UM82_GLOAU